MPYRAFISYSHEADGEFADALHNAMERLAKPWTKRRARRVALDKTAMAAGASLSDTIEEKLSDSEWLVLLAAPKSAESKWVDDEIDYWKANKSMDKVIVTVDRQANTSAATIPLALAEACDDGRIAKGHLVALTAMGGGFTWGSALVRW